VVLSEGVGLRAEVGIKAMDIGDPRTGAAWPGPAPPIGGVYAPPAPVYHPLACQRGETRDVQPW